MNIRITETRVYVATKADPKDMIEYRWGGYRLVSVSRPGGNGNRTGNFLTPSTSTAKIPTATKT